VSIFNPLTVDWVLDTGAFHHMTSNLATLTNIYTLSTPVFICQPDGRQVKVEKAGLVKLGPNIILKDVLYTPTFKCNLISAKKLAVNENCVISYGPNFCLIQDLTLKMLIGASDPRNGVYYLKSAWWIGICRNKERRLCHMAPTSGTSSFWKFGIIIYSL